VKKIALAFKVISAARVTPWLVTFNGPRLAITVPGVEKEKGSMNQRKMINAFTTSKRFTSSIIGFWEDSVIIREKIKAKDALEMEEREATTKANIIAAKILVRGQVSIILRELGRFALGVSEASWRSTPTPSSWTQFPHIALPKTDKFIVPS
jgi:hypothetical protein